MFKCLSGEALSVVKGVDNDYGEMVYRLDMKYGRAERLVDSILNDLKKIKRVQEGENLKFIGMVDTIEKCWYDLKRMKLEREMNTATIVSQIEKLLPPIQKREWALRKDRSESDIVQKGFQVFLDFLLEEKNALEYIEADSRESGSYSKGKVNTTITENDDERNDNIQESNTMSVFHTQIKENNEMMKQVIDGLAQVAQAMSNSKSRTGRQNAPDNMGTIKYKCWYNKTDNHDIIQCNVFQRLDVQGKLESLRQNNGCFSCLKIGHQSRQCRNKVPCDMLDQYGHQCMRFHHKWLHVDKNEGQFFHNSTQIVNENPSKDQVLLMVSSVRCKGQAVTTLWDPGANMSLITHKAAKRLGLHGKDVILSTTKIGNVHEKIQSKVYLVPLTDLMGKTWNIKVYGMEEVTAKVAPVDTREIMKLFAPKINLCRPTGEVDMLIGTDCCILMPNLINQIGNLQLMRNQFGYCLRGSHPLLQARNDVSHETNRIYWATGRIFNVNAAKILFQDSINRKLDSVFDVEGLSQCSIKCGSCKCGNCVAGQSQHSLREERELALIESGMKHDETSKQWVVQYPWTKDPKGLPNNVSSAVARMKSTEHRLIRNGQDYAKAYDDQIQDMCKHGVARKLTSDELMNYKGPVHYIPHHEVLKPESKSTPVRIVFNSSASYMGHTLNDCWAKGSNVLNDLLAILIRFRQEQVALTGDISKMYNAVNLSPNDQHTHRFVWRNLETHRRPDHYVLTTVTFGDKPSGAIAICTS